MCDYDDICPNDGARIRGDLLLCDEHAREFPVNVGRTPGEVRCWCGYFKPVGAPCGEPCL